MIEVHGMAGLNELRHSKQWLVHLNNLEAHKHCGRVSLSKLHLSFPLTEVHNNPTVCDFILGSNSR